MQQLSMNQSKTIFYNKAFTANADKKTVVIKYLLIVSLTNASACQYVSANLTMLLMDHISKIGPMYIGSTCS